MIAVMIRDDLRFR